MNLLYDLSYVQVQDLIDSSHGRLFWRRLEDSGCRSLFDFAMRGL